MFAGLIRLKLDVSKNVVLSGVTAPSSMPSVPTGIASCSWMYRRNFDVGKSTVTPAALVSRIVTSSAQVIAAVVPMLYVSGVASG